MEKKYGYGTIKVPIFNDKVMPYFYVRSDLNTDKYRISLSHEHINKNYGLNVSIIRDTKSIKQNTLFRDVEGDLLLSQRLFNDTDKYTIQSTEHYMNKNISENSRVTITKINIKLKVGMVDTLSSVILIEKIYKDKYSNTNDTSIVFFSDTFTKIDYLIQELNAELLELNL